MKDIILKVKHVMPEIYEVDMKLNEVKPEEALKVIGYDKYDCVKSERLHARGSIHYIVKVKATRGSKVDDFILLRIRKTDVTMFEVFRQLETILNNVVIVTKNNLTKAETATKLFYSKVTPLRHNEVVIYFKSQYAIIEEEFMNKLDELMDLHNITPTYKSSSERIQKDFDLYFNKS